MPLMELVMHVARSITSPRLQALAARMHLRRQANEAAATLYGALFADLQSAFAKRLRGDSEQAEQLAHRVLVSLFRRIIDQRFIATEHCVVQLAHRISRCVWCDALRRRYRRQRVLADLVKREEQHWNEVTASRVSPHEVLQRKEELSTLRTLLQPGTPHCTLSREECEVISGLLDGDRAADIARRMRVERYAITRWKQSACRKLARCFNRWASKPTWWADNHSVFATRQAA